MIYLDYAAHAPADPVVLERFCDMERRFPANPNSVHAAGKAAREEMARVPSSGWPGTGVPYRRIARAPRGQRVHGRHNRDKS